MENLLVESNTDRLWFTVGAIIVGAMIVWLFKDQIKGILDTMFEKFGAEIGKAFDKPTPVPAPGGAILGLLF